MRRVDLCITTRCHDFSMLKTAAASPHSLPSYSSGGVNVTPGSPQTAFRSVEPFVQYSPVFPSHRQSVWYRHTQTTEYATTVQTGLISVMHAMRPKTLKYRGKPCWKGIRYIGISPKSRQWHHFRTYQHNSPSVPLVSHQGPKQSVLCRICLANYGQT